MKITEEFLQGKNVLCAECLSSDFEITENGIKCKKCGFESDVLDNSIGEYISKMNEFLNMSEEEQDRAIENAQNENNNT
jgi:hypothetical protein